MSGTAEHNSINDLTRGPIWKKLVLFFLPICAGRILQQLYNTVDAVIVSRFVGTEALAAVGGSNAMLTDLVIGFFTMFSAGAAVVIAQYCGAREGSRIKAAVRSSILFCAAAGIAVSVIMLILAEPILKLLNTPAETIDGALIYYRIFFGSCIFNLVFNMGASILRAVGDSRRPFIYLIVSCASNIALDLLFVVVFKWGVAGAAWATVIAQAISCVLVIVNLIRSKETHALDLSSFKIDFMILKKMLAVGIPTGLQSSMYSIANLIVQTGINSLGTVTVAAWSLYGKLDGFYWSATNSFGAAIMNFVAQNYGAGKYDRIHKCIKTGFITVLIGCLCINGLILGIAKPVYTIFTTDTAVRETCWYLTLIFAPMYIFWTPIEALNSTLRGRGDTLRPTIILALGVCALRIVWIYTAFQIWHNLLVLSLCFPISWAVTAVVLFIYYKKRKHINFPESHC
ncbi:MAG: MATE family efflux transporter [Parasporobacterium sp.]|nr:MATE family efflux transporter [Parasporobacterium sp.]